MPSPNVEVQTGWKGVNALSAPDRVEKGELVWAQEVRFWPGGGAGCRIIPSRFTPIGNLPVADGYYYWGQPVFATADMLNQSTVQGARLFCNNAALPFGFGQDGAPYRHAGTAWPQGVTPTPGRNNCKWDRVQLGGVQVVILTYRTKVGGAWYDYFPVGTLTTVGTVMAFTPPYGSASYNPTYGTYPTPVHVPAISPFVGEGPCMVSFRGRAFLVAAVRNFGSGLGEDSSVLRFSHPGTPFQWRQQDWLKLPHQYVGGLCVDEERLVAWHNSRDISVVTGYDANTLAVSTVRAPHIVKWIIAVKGRMLVIMEGTHGLATGWLTAGGVDLHPQKVPSFTFDWVSTDGAYVYVTSAAGGTRAKGETWVMDEELRWSYWSDEFTCVPGWAEMEGFRNDRPVYVMRSNNNFYAGRADLGEGGQVPAYVVTPPVGGSPGRKRFHRPVIMLRANRSDTQNTVSVKFGKDLAPLAFFQDSTRGRYVTVTKHQENLYDDVTGNETTDREWKFEAASPGLAVNAQARIDFTHGVLDKVIWRYTPRPLRRTHGKK